MIKKFIMRILGLSEKEAKEELRELTQEEEAIVGYVKSENERIQQFLEVLKKSDEWLESLNPEDFFNMGERIDAFSRIKQNIKYFSQSGEYIADLADKAIHTEKQLNKELKNFSDKKTKHDLKLFKKEEKDIKRLGKKIKDKSIIFFEKVRELQAQEKGVDEKSRKLIEDAIKETFDSLNSLRKAANKLALEFNKAVEITKNSLDDAHRSQAAIAKHIELIEKGILEQSSQKETDEHAKALTEAYNNFSDPLYTKNRQGFSELKKYHEQKYEHV